MKEIIFYMLLFAAFVCFLFTDFKLTWKPFNISIESFSWGYAVGTFLVVIGIIFLIGYAKYQGSIEGGCLDGFEDGIKKCVEMIEKNGKENKQ